MKYHILTDTHFHHRRIVSDFGRPKGFEEKILKSMKQIEEGDIFIHLGDICIGNDDEEVTKLLHHSAAKINILVKGNHDGKSGNWYMSKGFSLVVESLVIRYEGKNVLFSHKPLPRQPGVDFNVHGHSHGNAHRDEEHTPFYESGYHVEFALEKTGYRPLLIRDLIYKKK